MPYKRGAPKGNTNRLKHGHFAAATIDLRRACRRTLNEAKAHLADLRAFGRLVDIFESVAALQAAGADPKRLALLAHAFEAALTAFETGRAAPRKRGARRRPALA
ncbi:MAG TPA: hypothetical protein VGB91_03035, partial [Rhizomicrobium sp.]